MKDFFLNTVSKIKTTVVITISALSLSFPVIADNVDPIQNNLDALIAQSAIDYTKLTHTGQEVGEISGADMAANYKTQFKRMLKNDLAVPTVQFDPNSRFEFSLKVKNNVNHRKQFIDIEDKKGYSGNISNLTNQKDSANKHIQNYTSYKCSLEKERLANVNGTNMNLEVMVDEIMKGIGDVENDIKASISKQVSQTFASLSSFFSPEYAFEMIFRIIKNEMATQTCNFCKESNQAGCNGIFMLAETYKNPTEDGIRKKIVDGYTVDKEKEKQKGSALDATWGVSCTTESALATPSGIHFSSILRKRSISSGVKAEYLEVAVDEIDAIAFETCTTQTGRAITEQINTTLKNIIKSLEIRTETQSACVAENQKDSVVLGKRYSLVQEQADTFYDSINKKIKATNEYSQDITSAVMDVVLTTESLFYGKPTPDDKDYTVSLAKYLKDTESLDASAVGNVYFNSERARAFIMNEDSSSNAKYLASTMVDSIANMLRHGSHIKLEANTGQIMDLLFMSPEESEKLDFIKDDVQGLRAQFEQDVDFYTGRVWNELTKDLPEDSAVYSCKEFEKGNLTDVRRCFVIEELNKFESQNRPDTCSCSSFGFSQELTPPMIPFFRHLKSEIDPDGIYENYTLSMKDPLERRYKYYLKNRLLNYIDELRAHTLNLQAAVDFRLTKLPIEEQEEVRRLFREVSGIFK